MLKQGQESEVTISISVPESLAEFISAAIESGGYMWVITYQNPLKPGVFEHARAIRNFQIPEILPSLEKHKEEFTMNVVQPYMARETVTMVDGSPVQRAGKQGLKVVDIPAPGAVAAQDNEPDVEKAREEHPGWGE